MSNDITNQPNSPEHAELAASHDMIDYITADNLTGYFTVNGSFAHCDRVLDLFVRGVKAAPEAHAILTKWAREAEEKAAACEKAWEELAERYPGGFY